METERGDSMTVCTCQYPTHDERPFTPSWYITVKTCPLHEAFYSPQNAPEWAWQCGPGGEEVLRDKRSAEAKA